MAKIEVYQIHKVNGNRIKVVTFKPQQIEKDELDTFRHRLAKRYKCEIYLSYKEK